MFFKVYIIWCTNSMNNGETTTSHLIEDQGYRNQSLSRHFDKIQTRNKDSLVDGATFIWLLLALGPSTEVSNLLTTLCFSLVPRRKKSRALYHMHTHSHTHWTDNSVGRGLRDCNSFWSRRSQDTSQGSGGSAGDRWIGSPLDKAQPSSALLE